MLRVPWDAMGEPNVFLIVLGVLAIAAVVVFVIIRVGRSATAGMDLRRAQITPKIALAETVVTPGVQAELEAETGLGIHKLWLVCPDASSWSADVTIHYWITPPRTGAYREGATLVDRTERFKVGNDGESSVNTSGLPTAALYVPTPPGLALLQLLPLPPSDPGTVIHVSLLLANLRGLRNATLRLRLASTVV